VMQRRPLILVSLLLAAFVINLDITIVNVALPPLVRELHATNSQLQWIVGGLLLEQFNWSSIFFAMAPVAFVGAALVAWSVPTSRDPGANKTDGPGLVLSGAAMALLTYTIIEAPGHGWSSARSLVGFALT